MNNSEFCKIGKELKEAVEECIAAFENLFDAVDIVEGCNEELKKMLRYITLPSYGQMFGHDEWYEKAIMPDDDEQLPLMKIRKNRICTYENDNCWYWLRNSIKDDYSSDCFAGVGSDGTAGSSDSDGSDGVRPVFSIG